jgi:hypothetical protein
MVIPQFVFCQGLKTYLGFHPLKPCNNETLGADGTSFINGNSAVNHRIPRKIPETYSLGAVEDEPDATLLRIMMRHEEDGPAEIRIPKRGHGHEQGTREVDAFPFQSHGQYITRKSPRSKRSSAREINCVAGRWRKNQENP